MRLILIISILLPLTGFSQDSTSTKWAFGFQYSNDWCDRWSTADNDNAALKSTMDSLESGRYGFGFGGVVRYQISAKHGFMSGLSFQNRGYKVDTLSQFDFVDMRFNYRYLTLPLQWMWTPETKRNWKPFVAIGLFASYLLNQRTTYLSIGDQLRSELDAADDLSSLSFGSMASLGLQRSIFKSWEVQLSLQHQQALSSISDTPYKRFLYATGINIVLSKRF